MLLHYVWEVQKMDAEALLDVETSTTNGKFAVSLTNDSGHHVTDLTVEAQAPDGETIERLDVPQKLVRNATTKEALDLADVSSRAGRLVIKGEFQTEYAPKDFTRTEPVEYS